MKTLDEFLDEEDVEMDEEQSISEILGQEVEGDAPPENRGKPQELISKSLRQLISDYVRDERSPHLPSLIRKFNEDITAKILGEGDFGLNYLGLDFLKALLKNLETMGLSSQLELLNLLKTIKFNFALVPSYYYAQIDVFIAELSKYIAFNLHKSKKCLSKLCEFMKILLAIDLPPREPLRILEEWILNISDEELLNWNWGTLSFLSKSLRKREVRNSLRYQFAFKEKLFDVVERKLTLQEKNEDLQSLCNIFQIILNFSTAIRVFSKKTKSINGLIDKILDRPEKISFKAGLYLFKSFLLMSFVYKQKELLRKFEESATEWNFREERILSLMYLGSYLKQNKIEEFANFRKKIIKDLDRDIFLRLRFQSQKSFYVLIWQYCKLFSYDHENASYYRFFYEQLLAHPIDRGNYIYYLQILRIYSEWSFPYSELLSRSFQFFSRERGRLSLQQKVIFLKLISDREREQNADAIEFSESLLRDLREKIAILSYGKLLLILVNEAFQGGNTDSINSMQLRKILLNRLGDLWSKLNNVPGFLLSISKTSFPNEPHIEAFLDSKINEKVTSRFISRFLIQFTIMSSSTKDQLTLLRKILRRCEISIIRKNREMLLGILGELNLFSIYEEFGKKNSALNEITQILNNSDILDDSYNPSSWRIFKSYLVFLMFNEFPCRAGINVIFKQYRNKIPKFKESSNFEEKFRIFTEMLGLLSLASHGINKYEENDLLDTFRRETILLSGDFYPFLAENLENYFKKGLFELYMFNSIVGNMIFMRECGVEHPELSARIWKLLLNEVIHSFFGCDTDPLGFMFFEVLFKLLEIEIIGIHRFAPETHITLSSIISSYQRANPVIMKKLYYGIMTFSRKFEAMKVKRCDSLAYYEEPIAYFFHQITLKPDRIAILYFSSFLKIFAFSETKNQEILASLALNFRKLFQLFDKKLVFELFLILCEDLKFVNDDMLEIAISELDSFKENEAFWNKIVPFIEERASQCAKHVDFKEKIAKLGHFQAKKESNG